jgi:8-oxo-dGTP pyrophosphatase MutT (NUDIX family)
MEHRILYRTPRFDVCSAPVHTATETDRRFYYVDKPDAVAVIAVAGASVLLLRVTRPLAPESRYELPGGRIERGETPEQAAKRELQEEAAVTFKSLRHLGRIHALPSVINEAIHVFGGRIAGPRPETLTTQAVAEGIEDLRFFAIDDVRRMMSSGDIGVSADVHALVIAWEWLEQGIAT